MADTHNIKLYQGADYALGVTLTDDIGNPIDLTSATAAAMVREDFTSVSPLVTCAVNITNAAGGELEVVLTDTQTAALSAPAATPAGVREAQIGVWDLEVTDSGGTVTRYLEGAVYLSREATK